jgi:hypothetical protein
MPGVPFLAFTRLAALRSIEGRHRNTSSVRA